MTGRIEGKVAFITGVARGQGRAHAMRLAEEGADIIGIDVCAQIDGIMYPLSTPEDLAETVELVEKLGRHIITGVADVRDRASMSTVLEEGLSQFGRLDIVVANAGVMPAFGREAQNQEQDRRVWQICLDVLLTGAMNTVELTYPRIVAGGGGGSIVLIGSMSAPNPMIRTEATHTLGLLAYSAAKAGLVNLARNYASLLASESVRVNIVQPTSTNTKMVNNDMMAEFWASASAADRGRSHALPVLQVEPEDIANAALWLASDESRFITGSTVSVDAGASLR
jgi:SDR family mycofactocin-dependent oxidoreductase